MTILKRVLLTIAACLGGAITGLLIGSFVGGNVGSPAWADALTGLRGYETLGFLGFWSGGGLAGLVAWYLSGRYLRR